MSLALEYIFRVFLYVAVILLLIGMFWHFMQNVLHVCLIGCEDGDQNKCDFQTEASTETYFGEEQIEKYCQLCWEGNKKGECRDNKLCYAVNSEYGVNTNANVTGSIDYCEFSCSNPGSHSVFVQYDYGRQKVMIEC
jgi:hypothetical protein